MKTPIQEFYEFMEQNKYFVDNVLYAKYRELLKKEKEVITDAFDEGEENQYLILHCSDIKYQSPEDYYNETFNTKEK